LNKYILILGVLSLVLFVDNVHGEGWTRSAGESLWTLIGSNIYRDSEVGIGTGGDPDADLHIQTTLGHGDTELRLQNSVGVNNMITFFLGTEGIPTREWTLCNSNTQSDDLLLINLGSDCNSDSMVAWGRFGQTMKKGSFQFGDYTTIIGSEFSVRYENFFKTQNFLGVTITNFLYGVGGQIIYIICDLGTTIQDNSNIHLSGGVDLVCTNDDTISLIYDDVGRAWFELSRSIN